MRFASLCVSYKAFPTASRGTRREVFHTLKSCQQLQRKRSDTERGQVRFSDCEPKRGLEISKNDHRGEVVDMTEIAISDEYKRSFNRLTEKERFRVSQLMNEIQYDCVSNGSRPEQLQCLDGKILKSYRVNDDLRLILYKWRKDGWLAITCGHHDETYNRVKRMRPSFWPNLAFGEGIG